jgi:hypothetical protein
MSDAFDDLVEKARERAETPPTPADWGYRVQLDPSDSFVGRWRGEAVDEQNANRRIFLFWDSNDQPCFSRTYTALAREIDRVQPTLGCTIVVYRGDDYAGQGGNPGYAFGVVTEPNDAAPPVGGVSLADGQPADDDEFPF